MGAERKAGESAAARIAGSHPCVGARHEAHGRRAEHPFATANGRLTPATDPHTLRLVRLKS